MVIFHGKIYGMTIYPFSNGKIRGATSHFHHAFKEPGG